MTVVVGRLAVAQVRVMRVVVGRIAGDRQEGDALWGNFDPTTLAGQELEIAALLAIRSRRAIVAAAAQTPVLAVHAGVDFVRARRPRAARSSTRRRELRIGVLSACQPLLLAAERSRRSSMRSGRVPKASLGRGFLPVSPIAKNGRHAKDCFAEEASPKQAIRVHTAVASDQQDAGQQVRHFRQMRRWASQEPVTPNPAAPLARLICQWNHQAVGSSRRNWAALARFPRLSQGGRQPEGDEQLGTGRRREHRQRRNCAVAKREHVD